MKQEQYIIKALLLADCKPKALLAVTKNMYTLISERKEFQNIQVVRSTLLASKLACKGWLGRNKLAWCRSLLYKGRISKLYSMTRECKSASWVWQGGILSTFLITLILCRFWRTLKDLLRVSRWVGSGPASFTLRVIFCRCFFPALRRCLLLRACTWHKDEDWMSMHYFVSINPS